MTPRSLRFINASFLAVILSIASIVMITIWAELSAPFKGWLAGISGHHWVTKSIFATAFYALALIVFGLAAKPFENERWLKSLILLTILTSLLGSIALLGFFTWHFFS